MLLSWKPPSMVVLFSSWGLFSFNWSSSCCTSCSMLASNCLRQGSRHLLFLLIYCLATTLNLPRMALLVTLSTVVPCRKLNTGAF